MLVDLLDISLSLSLSECLAGSKVGWLVGCEDAEDPQPRSPPEAFHPFFRVRLVYLFLCFFFSFLSFLSFSFPPTFRAHAEFRIPPPTCSFRPWYVPTYLRTLI